MSGIEPVRAGIIGCGNVSAQYLAAVPAFRGLTITASADQDPAAAEAVAGRWGLRAMPVEALLADPEIELVINLTIPAAHLEVGLRVLDAGKHLYAEKPLAMTAADGRRLVEHAQGRGLRLGCAPDTFLGGAHQAVRAAVDEGRIGRVVSATAFMMSHGMEHWHPNPGFFFQPGGGPALDVGIYYVAMLVSLMGPVARVTAMTGRAFDERVVTSEPRRGTRIPVEIPTHVAGILQFEQGAIATLVTSWDVWRHGHAPMELYGTEGSLLPPDPNFFGGTPQIAHERGEWEALPIEKFAFALPNYTTSSGELRANHRSVGVVDMAWAIRQDRPHRCSAELSLHSLEVLEALQRSADEARHVDIESRCDRPQAVPPGDGERVFAAR